MGIWLKENPANGDFFKTFIEQTVSQEEINLDIDVQEAWKNFRKNHEVFFHPAHHSTDLPADRRLSPAFGITNRRDHWRWLVPIAVLVILVLLLFSKKITTHPSNADVNKTAARKITTSKGERTNLILNDGTYVTLNAASTLTIPGNYGVASRTIYLKGEAFFKVTHDESHPFTVMTKHAYIRDLGTKFDVIAYDSSETIVAVSDGLVSLGRVKQGTPQRQLTKIPKNKLGVLNNIGKLTVSDIQDMGEYTGWTDGRLVFRKAPFTTVLKHLERWYDITCKVSNPNLYQRTLTASYDKMSMREVLKVLSLSLHVSYVRHNRTIIFRDENEAGKLKSTDH